VAADCPGAVRKVVDVWPLPLEPWLPAERRAARSGRQLPAAAGDGCARWCCRASRGAVIKRLPGTARVMLALQTTGGEGRRWWFLNGEPQMPPAPEPRYRWSARPLSAGGDGREGQVAARILPCNKANAQLLFVLLKLVLF
jgi:membrane carboxypeptidase/penicillin-binding protein PbpC